MKHLKIFILFVIAIGLLSFQQINKSDYSRRKITQRIYKDTAGPDAGRTINMNEWTTGLLPDTTGSGTPTTAILNQLIIGNTSLKPLGITLAGSPLLVSNNPERFTGDGWLMQHNRVDPTQGGVDYPLSGTNRIYFFHINFSGASKYVHLMLHNPGSAAITYSAKGSAYTNVDYPLPANTPAVGQSYNVSKDWITNSNFSVNSSNISVPANTTIQIIRKSMNANNMVDGLFEVTTSGPVYFYTVVTNNGTLTSARNATTGSYAPYQTTPTNDYKIETTSTFGREAGLFSHSEVHAENDLIIPDAPSRIGFCINTTAKFFPVEEQTAPNLVKTPPTTDSIKLAGSSTRSYGNYGSYYNVMFHLKNASVTTKTVRVYFASNVVDAASSGGTWNTQVKLNSTFIDIYTQRNNPRKLIATLTVPSGITDANLSFYVPGLITTNQQLIFETITTAVPSTLPVVIKEFTGKNQGSRNILSWKVEQESNLSHYELQRSSDGSHFVNIGRVKANNVVVASQYTYDDIIDSRLSSPYSYRIKSVDYDGHFKLSQVVQLQQQGITSFHISNNPFTDKFSVQYAAASQEIVTMKLYSTDGTIIASKKIMGSGGTGTHTFDQLQSLPSGIYLFEINIGNKREIQQLVKLK
jgi:hypothetical protein